MACLVDCHLFVICKLNSRRLVLQDRLGFLVHVEEMGVHMIISLSIARMSFSACDLLFVRRYHAKGLNDCLSLFDVHVRI